MVDLHDDEQLSTLFTDDGLPFAWRDILPIPADGLSADAFVLPGRMG